MEAQFTTEGKTAETNQVGSLVACLAEAPLSNKDDMERLELSHRPTFQKTHLQIVPLTHQGGDRTSHRPTKKKAHLQAALVAGLIEMTQTLSPNSPTQKCRLIKLGRAAAQR